MKLIKARKKKNLDGKRLLRQLKEKYDLTWSEIAEIFGLSESRICDLYGNNKIDVPSYYLFLIVYFLKDELIMKEYKAFIRKYL